MKTIRYFDFVLLTALGAFLLSRACKPASEPQPFRGGSLVFVDNLTAEDTMVHIAFGSDSTVRTFDFCAGDAGTGCAFKLLAKTQQLLPLNGAHFNATFAFDAPVGCGATKAEVNANNPKWYSTLDVSLVDGYTNKIQIKVIPGLPAATLSDAGAPQAVLLGPPIGAEGNEKVFGLFPFACDLCAARGNPPCGGPANNIGCKAGTQYNPTPVCQYQGPVMGGGEIIHVQLVE